MASWLSLFSSSLYRAFTKPGIGQYQLLLPMQQVSYLIQTTEFHESLADATLIECRVMAATRNKWKGTHSILLCYLIHSFCQTHYKPPVKNHFTSGGNVSRIFITGSTDGLGLATARSLLANGHDVIVHARSIQRLEAIHELLTQGARAVTGDLSVLTELTNLADQVNCLGPVDAVIHNAGVGVDAGRQILPVNVIAPYVLTALITRPTRIIFLSSGMHRTGRVVLDGLDWSGRTATGSYSDSKLFVTVLATALARRWPDVISSAVDPGWVPTKMGGADATGDLRQGHLTQEWLATSNEPEAMISGAYWHHQRREEPSLAARDQSFQDALLSRLGAVTGITL